MLALLTLSLSAFAAVPVRVATWNIETLGAPGSAEYEAALDVVTRIGADVICVNEVGSAADAAIVPTFAADAGYANSMVAGSGAFGSDRTACFSDLSMSASTWTAAGLAEETAANDLTRLYVSLVVDVPGAADDLVIVANHWKSGSANSDEFRRIADAERGADLLARYAGMPTLFMGDLNAQVDDGIQYPAAFTSLPSGLPSAYKLGSDLNATMTGAGLVNDPFLAIAPYVSVIEAAQVDGDLTTRASSGRRIDYIFASPDLLAGAVGEIYNSEKDGLPGLLSYIGAPLAADACAVASDHLPVIVEVGLEDANLPPVADAGGVYAGTTKKNTSLSASRSTDPDGVIVTYEWSFGDGAVATGMNVKHRWTRVGTYTVTLTVTDDFGAKTTTTTTATIKSK